MCGREIESSSDKLMIREEIAERLEYNVLGDHIYWDSLKYHITNGHVLYLRVLYRPDRLLAEQLNQLATNVYTFAGLKPHLLNIYKSLLVPSSPQFSLFKFPTSLRIAIQRFCPLY